MNYHEIKWTDTANGTGIRLSLFVSGCPHSCQGCFNPEAWDFSAGEPFTPQIEEKILTELEKPYLRGLSLLGGEPFAPENHQGVLSLVKQYKNKFPQKDIWCYTGYVYEDIIEGKLGESGKELLFLLDILVDGLYIQEKRNFSLRFRGSENQRIIQIPPSISQKKLVFWTE